ncbi:MAG: protein kinase [Polyangiales bacterium]
MRICSQCSAAVPDADRFCSACGARVGESTELRGSDPLVGRIVGGTYVLQEVVGVGGMGRVYRAEQSTLGRTVAVKVIHPHLLSDDQTVARFYQEARAASRLNHPNSVSVIDFGRTDDGILYLAMEYLSGRDLALIMVDDGPLPLKRVCQILIDTLDALAEAHALGIVHRDLKPENILLRPLRSGDDLVKVVDFGLATIVGGTETSITRPGLVCGTPDYMSPEQGRGDPVDGRGDLYALGIMLFELVTGRLPFIDDTPTKVVLRHMNERVPNPQQVAPERNIPDSVVDVIFKALSKDADDRYQTASEMQEALRNVLARSARESKETTLCSSCGATNPVNAKYCGECGSKLNQRDDSLVRAVRPSFYPPLGSQRAFVGRETELAFVMQRREAELGGCSWVHVVADPGAGKTRFLTEVAEQCTEKGDLVIGAGAPALGAMLPYAPLRSMVAELLECDEAAILETALATDGIDAPLVRAGIEEICEPVGLVGSESRSRAGAVSAALHHCVIHRAARDKKSRVLMVVDDFSQCDGLTQATLREFHRMTLDHPVLLVTAGQNLRNRRNEDIIELSGFSEDEARSFVTATGRLDVARQLSALAPKLGNLFSPLYLEQLEALGLGDNEVAPLKLADAIANRTERLSGEARKTLQAIAVIGSDGDLENVRTLLAQGKLSGLDELVRNSLVQVNGDRVAIVHPFIGHLMEAFIPSEARKEMHRVMFSSLVEKGAPLEVVAEHAYRGADPMTSIATLERTGDLAVRRGDHLSAVHAYRRALEVARRQSLETGDEMMGSAIVSFSRKLGDAMSRVGDGAIGEGVLRESLELTDRTSPERAEMLLTLGTIGLRRDRPRDAMRCFGEALEIVADENPKIESRLQLGIGRVRRSEGDPTHATNAYRRAIELYDTFKVDSTTRSRVQIEPAETLIAVRSIDDALRELVDVETRMTKDGVSQLQALAIGTIGTVDELEGRRSEAIARYRQAADLASKAGDAPGYRRWETAARMVS